MSQNTVTKDLLKELVVMLHAHPDYTRPHELRFHLTRQDELILAIGESKALGRPLTQNILLHGVRESVPMLYGVKILWDAAETKLSTRIEANDLPQNS